MSCDHAIGARDDVICGEDSAPAAVAGIEGDAAEIVDAVVGIENLQSGAGDDAPGTDDFFALRHEVSDGGTAVGGAEAD